jgi:hypothetical protein
VGRFLAGFEKPICQCIRKNHAGEPADQQILDPETGAGSCAGAHGQRRRRGDSAMSRQVRISWPTEDDNNVFVKDMEDEEIVVFMRQIEEDGFELEEW